MTAIAREEGRGARWPGNQARCELSHTAERAKKLRVISFVRGYASSWLCLDGKSSRENDTAALNSQSATVPSQGLTLRRSVHADPLRPPQSRAREPIRYRKRKLC